MRGAGVLLVAFLGGASAITGTCMNWCSKYTCGTVAHCGGCTAANDICDGQQPHRMCNEDSSCSPSCTCDNVLAAPTASSTQSAPSSAPGPAPSGTCDTAAMSTLKSRLQSMVSEQKKTNSALTQAVYPGANPFPPPAAPSPPPSSGSCAKEYSQCGGLTFKGPTCCHSGSTCRYQNEYYSQCRK